MRLIILFVLIQLGLSTALTAEPLKVVTVTRPPFSMPENGAEDGFSMDLWRSVAKDLGRDFEIVRLAQFGDMLKMIRDGTADVAIANISITADREKVMDFSQPIFESGLQIMIPDDGRGDLSVLRAVFSRDLLTAVALAMALLFVAGMIMWRLERRAQPYFDKPAKQAAFPAFWWALNLVVNGGFEERSPQTFLGRLFGVFLVISSLFLVSIFVANVTAVLTVDAIRNNVNSINDLYGKQVATIEGSTASIFLNSRDMRYRKFSDLGDMLQEFENGSLDAIVFDAPILAYYANKSGGRAKITGPTFRRENYGIALPSGSALAEPINQSLLRLREDGTYASLYRKWFGSLQ
jgi:polar amino acid transport system substrate-binding protein